MKKNNHIIIPILIFIFAFILIAQGVLDFISEQSKIERADKSRQEFISTLNDTINTDSTDVNEAEVIIKELEYTIEVKNNNIQRMQSCRDINALYEGTLSEEIHCDNIPVLKRPNELFYGLKKSDNPYVSQKEESHYHPNMGGILATDIAAGFRAEVYAPDYLNELRLYTVEVLHDTRIDANGTQIEGPLGNYLKLNWTQSGLSYYWIMAHVETKLQTGDIIYTGQKIGQTDLSGATTGHHLHQELWIKTGEDWRNISYTGRSKSLLNARSGQYDNDGVGVPIYFTHYNLGSVAENDETPCVGASGVDTCVLQSTTNIQTVAITVDIRNLYGIKLGDTITLENVDSGIKYEVQVHDEKAMRYRTNCYRDVGKYCNKGDVAFYEGKTNNGMPSGNYLILK